MMKANLVCQGGGVKGIALIGAIQYLEEEGFLWENVCGTSVGAIVASLIASDFSANELKDIMLNTDFSTFTDRYIKALPILGDAISLLLKKGVYKGNGVEKLIKDNILKQGYQTFGDYYKNGDSRLKVIAVNSTDKKIMVIPDNLEEYGFDPRTFSVSKAVRMSMSIPFIYQPVVLNSDDKYYYIIDGGILSNFPIWLYNKGEASNYPTIGLKLVDDTRFESYKKASLSTHVVDVLETALATDDEAYINDENNFMIISIPTLGVKTTDFNLSYKTKESLFNAGYNAAKKFCEQNCCKCFLSKFNKSS